MDSFDYISDIDKEKIINIAIEGKSAKEIAAILPFDENEIRRFIASLNHKGNSNYKPNKYQDIVMNRQKRTIDKDFIDEIIKLIYEGFTFTEIAAMYENTTEEEVKRNIYFLYAKNSPFKDKFLYSKVMRKQQQNQKRMEEEIYKRLESLEKNGVDLKQISSEMVFKRFERKKRIREMILDCLDSNMSLSTEELARKHSLNGETVKNILNGTIEKNTVLQVIDEESFQNIQNAWRVRNQVAKEEFRKGLDKFFESKLTEEEKKKLEKISNQMNLWIPLLLTFQLSIEDLGILTNFHNLEELKKVVMQKADKMSNYHENTLNYLFTNRIATNEREREERITKAKKFLKELTLAQVTKNKEKERNLLQWLTDYKALTLLKNKKPIETLTPEELNTLMEYRIKYAMPYQYFPYTNNALKRYIPDKYKEEMQEISDYNDKMSKQAFITYKFRQKYLEENNLRPKR